MTRGLPVTGEEEGAKLGAFGRFMPGGNLRLAAEGLGEEAGAPERAPPTKPLGPGGWPPRRFCADGGAPWRDKEKAFILA